MPRKFAPLPRQTIQVGSRGRITIPEYLRDAANIPLDSWVEIEAQPNLKDCKILIIRRAL